MDHQPQSLTEREVDAFAVAFCTPVGARQVLAEAGLSAGRQPSWQGTAQEFWRELNRQLTAGVLADGRARLLAAARRIYPANSVFAGYRGLPPPAVGGTRGTALGSDPAPATRHVRRNHVQIGGGVGGQVVVGDQNVVIAARDQPAVTAPLRARPPSAERRVFLCHASQDRDTVRALHHRLRRDGIPAWLDAVDLLPGQEWDREIRRIIRASSAVLVCLSTTVVDKRGYVQKEIRHALDIADEQPDGALFLIPVRLEPCDVPYRLQAWQWVDLFAAQGYQRLLSSLRSLG
jgi:hypothetical protein